MDLASFQKLVEFWEGESVRYPRLVALHCFDSEDGSNHCR